MRLFDRVAIVGTGMIGGSIALEIKKKKLAHEVIGVSRRRSSLALAKKLGAIDKGSQNFNVVKDADFIILATPVSTILVLAPLISKIIKPDCLVTDVGSAKDEIVSKLDRIFPCYVGSHPLAGSEKRGVINASAGIFKNSLCILTPTKKTNRNALLKIKIFWRRLGARTVFLSPDNHDKILSFVSHLPHIAAFSVINSVPRDYLRFASTGLKDTTRLADSNNQLWADIFLSNRKNMLKVIELLQNNISLMKAAIQKRDRELLIRIIREANKKRNSLEKSKIQILPNPK